MENNKSNLATQEKLHYESLIVLFKYCIGIVTSLITLIGLIVGYITYTNGKEMRDAFEAERKEMYDQTNQMKAELKRQEHDMRSSVIDLIHATRQDVQSSKEDAIKQIDNIKTEATIIARTQAQNSINDVFDKNNVDQFIVTVAEERIVPIVGKLVDDHMSYYKSIEANRINNYISNLKGNNPIEIQISALYLQMHTYELTDEQISNIIYIGKNPKIYVLGSSCIDAIILYKESNLIKDYYRYKILNDDENYSNINSALTYLMQPNYNQDFELYKSVITKTINVQNVYLNFINTAKVTNEKLVLEFLNSKDIVDLVYTKTDKDQWLNLKSNVESNLLYKMKVEELKKTYFFTKVK